MNRILVGIAIGLLVSTIAVGVWLHNSATSQQIRVATKAYPTDLHYSNHYCLGTYDNGVSVAWPSIDGTC